MEKMTMEDFKHGLLEAMDQQCKTDCDMVRRYFSAHLYDTPDEIMYMKNCGGTYGRWWRIVITTLFGEMGELVCDRTLIF